MPEFAVIFFSFRELIFASLLFSVVPWVMTFFEDQYQDQGNIFSRVLLFLVFLVGIYGNNSAQPLVRTNALLAP